MFSRRGLKPTFPAFKVAMTTITLQANLQSEVSEIEQLNSFNEKIGFALSLPTLGNCNGNLTKKEKATFHPGGRGGGGVGGGGYSTFFIFLRNWAGLFES